MIIELTDIRISKKRLADEDDVEEILRKIEESRREVIYQKRPFYKPIFDFTNT